jgi:hypothetical protein
MLDEKLKPSENKFLVYVNFVEAVYRSHCVSERAELCQLAAIMNLIHDKSIDPDIEIQGKGVFSKGLKDGSFYLWRSSKELWLSMEKRTSRSAK